MAKSHTGVTHSSPTFVALMPPPSSLCPVCQAVEVDARQYHRDDVNEIRYACDNGHDWVVEWDER